jgi:hypothetical protein
MLKSQGISVSHKLFIFAILILFLSDNTFAHKEIEEIATKAGGN